MLLLLRKEQLIVLARKQRIIIICRIRKRSPSSSHLGAAPVCAMKIGHAKEENPNGLDRSRKQFETV